MSKIKDVTFGPDFMDDYINAPEKIQKQFNGIVERTAREGVLTPGVKGHKIKEHPENWWIGYVSVGIFAWRFLFSFTSSGVLVIERLLSHNEMDDLLR